MLWGGGPIQVDYFKKKNERLSTAGPEVFKLYITNFPGDFTENNIIEFDKADTKFLVERSDGLLYRYKIGDRYVTDETETMDVFGQKDFNIIKTSKN